MAKKQSEFVGIKLDMVTLIELDSLAENCKMNRSEFIKSCIAEQIKKQKTSNKNNQLNETDRLINALSELDESIITTRQLIIKGIIQIQKALIELHPNNSNLKNIFKGEK